MAKTEASKTEETKTESANNKNVGIKGKTPCSVTRTQFAEKAEPLSIKIGEALVVGEVKQFSTGSMGWNTNAKIMLPIDGKQCAVQVGINLIIVGSKDAE